ncbi:MAG TPA: type IV pilus secretin PilQ [Gallionellaceae bacterium]
MNNRAIGRTIKFLLLACALHALPALAQGGADAQNSIQALNVIATPDGKLVLAVTLKNPPAAVPGHFAATNPARLAFDFPGTANGLGKSLHDVNQGDVRNINIVQAGNRTRVVVNLAKMVAYDTRVEGNNVMITLNSLASAPPTARFAEETPSVQGHALKNIEFHRGRNGEGQIVVTLSDSGVGIDLKQEGSKIVVDFLNTKAPRNLQQKLDVLDFATPVESVDTFSQGNNIRLVISPKGLWDHSAYQTDNRFVVEIKPKTPDEIDKKDSKPVYVGTKLTLDVRNISIRDALSIIADFTGLNIVISDSVSGNLTLRLKDVPWDQALDIILQSKGLDMRKNGNVIQVAPRDEIASREKVQVTQQSEIADLEPLHTESFQLSYQKGEDIVTLISSKDQRILSKRGSAVVDARTNTVFIQDTPSRLEEVRRLIKQVDVAVRQVMIEARFVSASEKFSRNLGGRLGFANSNQAAPNAGFHVGGGQLGNATGSVNLPGATTGSGGLTFSLFNPANTKTLQLELYATEIEGTSKNIASPRVVTADNVQASIKSGTAIPYQQATSSGATSVAFKDAVLSLEVTPKITPDDHVNMKLTVSQDSVGTAFGSGSVPSIDTKKVTTQVVVENGGTVAIGGVYTRDTSNADNKVPMLGDLPIIGWFFRANTVIDNKNELLIFITPRILKDTLNVN